MARKVIIIADPGIDTAFALCLALNDPELEVVGVIATAGNVGYQQATQNIHILIAQTDPHRWPRLGAAPHVVYDSDGTHLHGVNGLGGAEFAGISLHTPPAGDKLLAELIREHSHEITIICLGPLTVLAQVFERDPDLAHLTARVVATGGTWREPGNATATAEFHFALDPAAARTVLRARVPVTLLPLDATRRLLFAPADLLDLPNPDSRTAQFLRQIVPFGIRATSNHYGVEGFHLKDVLGVIAVTRPDLLTTLRRPVEVEQTGELTRGMLVIDGRPNPEPWPAVELGTGVNVEGVSAVLRAMFKQAD